MKKTVLIILSLLIIGGVWYSHKQSKKIESAKPTAVDTLDKTAVLETANNFYKSYDSCMRNPPAQAKVRVSEYCQSNTGLSTTAFIGNLNKGGTAKAGADPIFCAQNPPENITVNSDSQITNDKAVVFVNEKFGTAQIKIQTNLVKVNGVWKIDNIVCPLPL